MPKTLGQVIRKRRRERGLSLGQMQIKTGLTKPALSDIETGKTNSPRIDSVIAIALALGQNSVDSLLIEADMLPPPDEDTLWTPELLQMQRFLAGLPEGSQMRKLAEAQIRAWADAILQIGGDRYGGGDGEDSL